MGKKKKKGGGKNVNKGQKKAEEKKKQKQAKDLTFGLKNKKKSKKVQKYVQSVKSSGSAQSKRGNMSTKERRKLKKMEEKARERELRRYFGSSAYTEKKKEKKSMSDVMDEVDEDMKDQKELTLVEIIEQERVKFINNGTPVTEESFRKWKEFRDKMKRTKERRMEKLKEVMTGKEIFMQKKAKFDDDEEAEVAENLIIDDSVYLDDFDELLDEANEEEDERMSFEQYLKDFTEESEYVPMLWKAVQPKKTPKSILLDILRDNNENQPVFVTQESDGMGGYMIRCVFQFMEERRELVNKSFVKKKKMAEHTASILAIKLINSLQ